MPVPVLVLVPVVVVGPELVVALAVGLGLAGSAALAAAFVVGSVLGLAVPSFCAPHAPTPMRTTAATSARAMRPAVRDLDAGAVLGELAPVP